MAQDQAWGSIHVAALGCWQRIHCRPTGRVEVGTPSFGGCIASQKGLVSQEHAAKYDEEPATIAAEPATAAYGLVVTNVAIVDGHDAALRSISSSRDATRQRPPDKDAPPSISRTIVVQVTVLQNGPLGLALAGTSRCVRK